MSQAHLGIVVEALLTDENLRIRFALERMEMIADLCVRGVELTSDEIDLLCQTDAHLWFSEDEVRREWRGWIRHPQCGFAMSGRRPITALSEEANVARVMDEIITQIAQRQTRRTQA